MSGSSNEEKLEAWVQEKLELYDADPEFAAKRNKKHSDRAGYEEHLREQTKAKLQAHADKGKSDGSVVPDQLHKEFMEQQEKITNAALQIQNVTDEIQKLQMTKRMNTLSSTEVSKTTEGVPLYKQYGKMFLQHPQAEMASTLKEQGEKLAEREEALKAKYEFFEKERSEAEINLKEMMSTLQAQMAAAGGAQQ